MTAPAATLYELGVNEAATAIAECRITPTELLESLIEQKDRVDPKIQAWSYLNLDQVRAEAKAMTEEAVAGKLRGPLHGVPFGVKEQFAVAGVTTLADWSSTDNPVATEDAVPVARLKASGALLMGKLFMVGPAGPPPTRNPWNLEHTPGGTSSGSGAAVAARTIPFSLSEQTAGSGIRPAMYTGVSGLKPTFGRAARHGMFTMGWSLDHVCIIARSVPDIDLVLRSIVGADPTDITSFDGPTPRAVDYSSLRPPRIGIVRNFFPERTGPVIQQSIEDSAAKWKAAGADVKDIMLPAEFGLAWASHSIIMGVEGSTLKARANAEKLARGEELSGMGVRGPASLVPGQYYVQAQRIKSFLRPKVDALYSDVDILVVGTAPAPAPYGLSSTGDTSLLVCWSYMGNPCLSIPTGIAPDGLPMGVQLVGPFLGDEQVLEAGAWCQSVLGTLGMPTAVA